MARPGGGCPRCLELERQLALAEARCEELAERVQRLEGMVRELRSRLELTSRNSSKPPSTDPPGRPPAAGAGKGKPARRRGGQPGHPGRTRNRFPEAEIDQRVDVPCTHCHRCGELLDPETSRELEPCRHQVVEVPLQAAQVTEYVLERRFCPHCREATCAPLPAGVPRGAFGPRLQAIVTLLVARYRLSRREAAAALQDLFGPKARMAPSSISVLEAKTTQALEAAYDQAQQHLQEASAVHADETGHTKQPRRWLWVGAADDVSYFRVDRERSRRALKKLLPRFQGVYVTDRYGVYASQPVHRRQLCWAHLQRDFTLLVERGPPAAPLGHAGLRACREITAAWRDVQAGRLAWSSLRARLRPVRHALRASLHRNRNSPDPKARALARDLLAWEPALWTFTRRKGVPPTNNRAERELRPAVLWRKGSFGARSPRGERFVATLLTVTRTIRHQGRNLLDFLVASIEAHLYGTPPPSLVPA